MLGGMLGQSMKAGQLANPFPQFLCVSHSRDSRHDWRKIAILHWGL
jgi:hypothetical protein